MHTCPNCRRRLRRGRTKAGLVYACRSCGGRMVSLAVLRKERMTQDFFRSVWSAASQAETQSPRLCPHCRRSLKEVRLAGDKDGAGLPLDVCTLCLGIWFDPGEHAGVPRRAAPLAPRAEWSPKLRQAYALERVRVIGERAEAAELAAGPNEPWQFVPAILCLPVESSAPEMTARPLATWCLIALCSFAYFLSKLTIGLDGAAAQWGFVPADWERGAGATLFFSAVLHGDLPHLLVNMYFLWTFGDNVEDDCGWRSFLVLFLGAHIAGVIAHGAVTHEPHLPLIGASGGISGLVGYYALAFPSARLGLFLTALKRPLTWVHLPAWGFGLLWIGLQLIGVFEQLWGNTNVSATGHLGGAAVGVAAALSLWGRRRRLRGDGAEPR